MVGGTARGRRFRGSLGRHGKKFSGRDAGGWGVCVQKAEGQCGMVFYCRVGGWEVAGEAALVRLAGN